MSNFANYMHAQERTRTRRAEWEGAAARLDLALRDERAAMLISQAEPVNSMGVDREGLRMLLSFLSHGDTARLMRDWNNHAPK